MANEINIEQQLLSHSHVGKQIQFKKLMPWFSFLMALAAIVGCLYLGLVTKAYNKNQKKMSQLILETQESLRENQAKTTEQLPDNIEIVIQDITDQISRQKNLTKDLESLVISDLRPQVAFLLKEFELGQRASSKVTPVINLVKQDELNGKEFLTKILGLAELYLSVLHDLTVADNLLVFAEQVLVKNNEAVAIKLKESIAKDRQALALVKMPDKAMIWCALDKLHANVAQYTYKKIEPSTEDNNVTNKNDVQINDWRLTLQKTWHELTALIKVKRKNNNVESLTVFNEAAENLQRARLCLLLEQTRLASFSGDDKVYNASIVAAKKILITYFEEKNILNNKAIAELDLLAAINIKPDLPLHIHSFQELEAI